MCFFLPMSCEGEGERLEKDTEAGTEQVLAMPGEEALGLSPRPVACKLKRLRKQRFLFLPHPCPDPCCRKELVDTQSSSGLGPL